MAVCVMGLLLPATGSAAGSKILTGTVISVSGSSVRFSNGTAAMYVADLGSAVLTRKNGSAMKFAEIFAGDKIQVKGALWPDNSFSATIFTDLSLYAHTGTFSGKITGINPNDSSFTIQSSSVGSQTIHTNSFTGFTLNGSRAIFHDLTLGATATVSGVWDRAKTDVTASKVDGGFRLINIDFIGLVAIKSSGAFTVTGNGNVMYGVDISKATLETKSGKTIQWSQVGLDDNVHVWGKHVSGSVAIQASKVKDMSLK